jgi:hypothetical protein
MEGILTEITDSNTVLEAIIRQQSYLAYKPAEKSVVEKKAKQQD